MRVVERAPALYAQSITRLYETSGRGVSEVSLEIQPGEVFGLLGPNGSGKSTLLRVLSTAIAPDSGTFRVGYADGLQEKREVRAKTGLMVDRPTHYGDLSGWANAFFFARSYGMEEEKAASALAELFDYFDLAARLPEEDPGARGGGDRGRAREQPGGRGRSPVRQGRLFAPRAARHRGD